MENNFEHIDNLVTRVVSGEASEAQVAELTAWGNVSPENLRYIESTKKLFALVEAAKITVPVNTNYAWNKLDERISDREAKVIPLFKRKNVLRIAASILLIAAIGIIIRLVLMDSNAVEPQLYSAKEQVVEKTLPDGSKVFINKNSEIIYSVKNNVREVTLKGEAFFEVVHNERQPFVITVDGVHVKDIGTAFNVKTVPETNSIEVLVESGEVQFYAGEDAGVKLIKGQKASYNKTSGHFTKLVEFESDNSMSYRSKIFHFKGTTLKKAIEQLNEVYSSDIQLSNEKIANCNLSVVFNNEKIDEIISIIAETLNLTIERKGQTIILKGEACLEK